ncbi:UvrD-helicase domain-containing protein (plasmid) [Cupriavidus necator H16]|uniref:DNA 3'-5' helicase II n=2 Tax=Cupriavidus necator (strain ATCC 17699 / DSM 428 / KCTC 22496 / NCIMB 10442 / H16 / Stanier 337) TaxID=381666 RepID=A0AAF1D5C3_CUPNH|nr:UvrD-helicase domain-containing protein [Cupriavidus necator]QCC05395.1 DNA helicase UvrD [Cupriavidus necator H16]QQB81564.1 UvrD-helicase domain-containing protein [Cupriavidus necator]
MANYDLDLLELAGARVEAPAGCGKTQMLTNALMRHGQSKPILLLTHTNAGVAALRKRLEHARVDPSRYRLGTVDGWAMKLVATFPARAGIDPALLAALRPDYNAIREAAARLLAGGHVGDVLASSYARLWVDEYQDCSVRQHAIIQAASAFLPTCVVGDPLQAIFGFGGDPLASWQDDVCRHFPRLFTLDRPWRWINAGAEVLGQWLLQARQVLLNRQPINLASAPPAVQWVQLDGSAGDHARLLQAAGTAAPHRDGTVLVIGDSTSPQSQQRMASLVPGAVTVEAVDLRDLVDFATGLQLAAPEALRRVVEFCGRLMTGVGVAALLERVEILRRGTARREPSLAEAAALAFEAERSLPAVKRLIEAVRQQPGTRVFRPIVLRACLTALDTSSTGGTTLQEAAIRIREQGRMQARALPRRAVGSTLLLKGLEAHVAVVLAADTLNASNLYVALTRGSTQLVVCSRTPQLLGR